MALLDEQPYVGYPQMGRRRAMPNTDVEMNQGLLRGASYYPYDLLGSPVDLINMGLQPLGLGSQKPVMGSDWLQSLAQEYGLSAQPTGSNSESVARLAMSLTNPAAGARFISKGVESSPSIAARIISPLSRPQQFTESTVTTEGLPKTLSNISGDTIAEALALERYKTAASPSLQNVIQRQGYWAGESNPVFVSEGNRSFTVGGNKSLLRDVAQTAENLEQAGATSTRATALPFGDLSQGNAAFLTRNGKPLTNADVTKLNKALSESTDAVLQHRKGGEGLLFKGNWIDGVTLQDMVNIAKKEIPDLRVKPALSTPEIDRAYFERPVYQSLGALPREESVRGKLTQAFDELLKKKGYRE